MDTPDSTDDDLLDTYADLAFSKLDALGGDPSHLSKPMQTLVVVVSAQGVIDNGGLEYFYSGNFPGNPPYTVFEEAFKTIGATPAAEAIAGSAALFAIPDPHLNLDHRHEVMKSRGTAMFSTFESAFEDTYKKLLEYCIKNDAAFRGR